MAITKNSNFMNRFLDVEYLKCFVAFHGVYLMTLISNPDDRVA